MASPTYDQTARRAKPVVVVDSTGTIVDNFGGPSPGGGATLTEQQTQTTHLSAIKTAVELIDNAVSGSELQVDVITLPTASVQGTAASGAADSGNPVKAGGVYNSTQPTVSNAQRVDFQTDTRGNLKVVLARTDSGSSLTMTNADAQSGIDAPAVASEPRVYNGSTWDRVRGDATNGLLVNLGANNDVTVTGTVGHDQTGVGDGRKTVTTAGTREALASSTAAKTVHITAETDNTGIVVVGAAATVVASLSTRRGHPLSAGESIALAIDNLADIGLDVTVSGDGVTYVYTT